MIIEDLKTHRQSEHSVNPMFLNRWSPRAYSNKPVSDEDLLTILDAAHWAPSSSNDQPWRYIVAKTKEQLAIFHDFLNEFNRIWAAKAPILILIASEKLRHNGNPNGSHAFDSGTAWGYLALQASLLGLYAHAMGGYDKLKAREALNLPEHIELHAVVALGFYGDKSDLPESYREREIPSMRRPLHEVIYKWEV